KHGTLERELFETTNDVYAEEAAYFTGVMLRGPECQDQSRWWKLDPPPLRHEPRRPNRDVESP
ncbi:hypothetical protein, partial [Haliangium sp.]|uniref:hypothetical protein n=1 Tax=Haliangium sp. TaxID=2663208 RepID=UPI003D0B4B3E